VLRDPSLAVDPRFNSGINRVKNRTVLDNVIQKMFSTVTANELMLALNKADIAFGRLNNVCELSSHECLKEQIVTNERMEEVALPKEPAQFIGPNMATVNSRVPILGEHTEKIKMEFGHGSNI
jgi:itaconate CoA-transferase